MSYKILVPLDGSTQSETALSYLQMLAGKTDVSVELLRCFEPPATVYTLPALASLGADVLADYRLQERMQEYLDGKQRELTGIPSDCVVQCGDPASEILSHGEKADLTVMASRGGSGMGRWLLGGVTSKVARSSPNPVLVVAGKRAIHPRLESIMVCLDGSSFGERAFQKALELGRAVGAKLVLYRFVSPRYSALPAEAEVEEATSYLSRLALAHPDLVADSVVRQTDGGHQIPEVAEELDVDLVVLGSHGRGMLGRWLMGSVTEDVLHQARCPVMVVH